jgi:hypothetical protein
MIFRRSDDGAEKCAFRVLGLDDVTFGLNFIFLRSFLSFAFVYKLRKGMRLI